MCEVGFFQVALAPYLLQTFAIDGTSSGNIFLIHAATSAVTCALFGVLVDKGFASVSFIVCTCLTAFSYFLLGLPLLITNSHHSQEITAKLLLYGGLALLGLTANGGFVPVYFLFERIAQLAKIDCQSKIRIYVCTWLNSCYAVGSILGQIVVGGFFFEAFEFYRSCLLLSVLASASFVAGLCYLMHSGLLKRAYDNEDVNETKTEETGQIKVTNLPTEIDA
ncbi:uncharacterized protein LOC134851480 isoform X1 [Symsagittifera roscoffensis]|uniref:uncharacterized protein LOC134851480 isoform X1 n=1 Tax=Symsagittifera roscoffensis TaxID=84072 RepID=UPI00307BA832